MDDAPQQARRSGGDLEPVDRNGVLKAQLRLSGTHRFELRDPFAEVTYRSNSFEEMIVKANRLGATRFSSIAPDGKRSDVSKENGQWLRPADDRSLTATLNSERPAQVAGPLPPAPKRDTSLSNQDEQAKRSARLAQLKIQLNERYVVKHAPIRIGAVTIGQTEYRHRGDVSRIAFTESTFRLSTDTNSPLVARSMVDVAEARGWQSIRVSGSDDFRRMVWLEASLRNVKAVGYEPVSGDLELLRQKRGRHQGTNPNPALDRTAQSESSTTKPSSRGGSRKSVLAALDALLVARHVPQAQREAVMKAAEENLSRRLLNGETLRVKVYDRSAPSQRPAIVPSREAPRIRERAAPSR